MKEIRDRALYRAVGSDVIMNDTYGVDSVIQTCRTPEKAKAAAKLWQQKENKAVEKAKRHA